ncbi:hypothetical protein [Streptomyces qinglanensis]|uniref:hypothetical protein n=1 Tax=Streptomyces qinglanensis TaxID=943816 RepID=UPI0037BBF749
MILTHLKPSPAFSHALPQLLITLEQTPDRVDDLILQCHRRFIEEHGAASGDISIRAAVNAHHIGELLVRAYTQAGTASRRSDILNLLDDLLLNGAQRLREAANSVGRPCVGLHGSAPTRDLLITSTPEIVPGRTAARCTMPFCLTRAALAVRWVPGRVAPSKASALP